MFPNEVLALRRSLNNSWAVASLLSAFASALYPSPFLPERCMCCLGTSHFYLLFCFCFLCFSNFGTVSPVTMATVGPKPDEMMAQRYAADIAAAMTAGFCVTPLVSAVDKALAENASGKAKLWPSFFASLREVVTQPVTYIRSPQFRWIWLIYGGTYAAANVVDTTCAATGTNAALPKWLATSFYNTVSCIGKDRAFAKLFGTGTVQRAVPAGSYAAWLSRDLISMAVFFTLPPIVAKEVAKKTGDEKTAYYASQIGLPLILQTVTTPIHLLGYDIYNNPNNSTVQRVAFMKKDYGKNVSIRMVRMFAPWSIGTIGNRELRGNFAAAFTGVQK